MTSRFLAQKLAAAGVVAGILGLAGCDLEVTNPGPVLSETIAATGAHKGLVNGVRLGVQGGFGQYALLGGAITHDLMASGHTGSAGVRNEEEVALLNDLYDGRGSWGSLHRARWIAEEAIRYWPENPDIDASTYDRLAEVYLLAGLANRYLGENACSAVFDGGAPEPKLTYFDRAIEQFSAAAQIAQANMEIDEIHTAAIGARAAARLFKGDWAGALSDAQQVPFEFELQTEFSGDGGEYFNTYGHVMSTGFQSLSYWGTPAAEHFLQTGDSRVAFGYDNGSREADGGEAKRAQTHPPRTTWTSLVPMFYPLKGIAPRKGARDFYIFQPNRSDQRTLQVSLVDGREMELVAAEALVRQGNWQAAMTHINNVRTSVEIYPIDMTDKQQFDLQLHSEEQTSWNANPKLAGYFDQNSYTLRDFSAGGMMPPVEASSMQEAWTALKFERLMELSLEGRRFGDRWRWRANAEPPAPSSGPGGEDTPGDYNRLEFIPTALAETFGVPEDPLMLCFPLPKAENDTNPMIDESYRDWVETPGYQPLPM